MLTNLDFLNPGSPWPPPQEVPRLSGYDDNEQLFEANHAEIYKDFVRLLREDEQSIMKLIFDFPGRMTKLFADLMLGDPPIYRVKGRRSSQEDQGQSQTPAATDDARQIALDELVDRTDFNTTSYEVVIDIPRFGDGLFRLRLENFEAVIEGQSPKHWFPVVSPSNIRRVNYQVLAWTFERVDPKLIPLTNIPYDEKLVRYLRVEIHDKGSVEHRLYRLNKSGEGALGKIDTALVGDEARAIDQDFPIDPIEITGCSDFLVQHAPGFRTTNRLHGYDDFQNLDSLLQELETRMSQISRVLDKHTDPNMAGPPIEALTITNSITGEEQNVMVGGGQYYQFNQDEGGSAPQYIVWNAELQFAFQQIEDLLDKLYFVSETSPAAFGFQKEGLAESGSALKRLLMAPLIKTRRIAMRFARTQARVLELAGELEANAQRILTADRAGNVTQLPVPQRIIANGTTQTSVFGGIEIEYRDGLPRDEDEESRITRNDIEAGIMSHESAMIRRFDMDRSQAREELRRIREENAAAMQAQQEATGAAAINRVIDRRQGGGENDSTTERTTETRGEQDQGRSQSGAG